MIKFDDIESTEHGYIKYAIQQTWGERCPDYCEGCAICDAWKQYDDLRGVNGWETDYA